MPRRAQLPALFTAFPSGRLVRTKRKKVVSTSPSPASRSQTPIYKRDDAPIAQPAMSVDAMEIDSPAARASDSPERERKRKHKQKDHTPSKKRKHDDDNAAAADSSLIAKEEVSQEKKSKKSKDKKKEKKDKVKTTAETAEEVSDSDSPFKLITSTLYLPLSPISISPTHALASLLAEHLSPLLLTYYPPFKGVILAYSDASISSKPPTASSVASKDIGNSQQLTLATTAGEYGVLYVYLTATFLVFRPQRGQTLEGWVNVQSEGFLGAVVYNLFSVGIERRRLPADWKWIPPGEEQKDSESPTPNKKKKFAASPDEDFDPEKEHFTPLDLANTNNALEDEAEDAVQGYFESASGHRVRGTIRFRVRDVDIIPGAERDRGFLSIEGTMLPPEEEARLVQEECSGVSSSTSSRRGGDSTAMTGALAGSSSVASSSSNPSGSQEVKEESSSKSKREKKEKEKEKDKDKDKSSKSKSKKKEK